MKKFERSFIGYDIDQVNHFVNEVVENYDALLYKLKERDLMIERLKLELKSNISKDVNEEKERIEDEIRRLKGRAITYKKKLSDLLDEERDYLDKIEFLD